MKVLHSDLILVQMMYGFSVLCKPCDRRIIKIKKLAKVLPSVFEGLEYGVWHCSETLFAENRRHHVLEDFRDAPTLEKNTVVFPDNSRNPLPERTKKKYQLQKESRAKKFRIERLTPVLLLRTMQEKSPKSINYVSEEAVGYILHMLALAPRSRLLAADGLRNVVVVSALYRHNRLYVSNVSADRSQYYVDLVAEKPNYHAVCLAEDLPVQKYDSLFIGVFSGTLDMLHALEDRVADGGAVVLYHRHTEFLREARDYMRSSSRYTRVLVERVHATQYRADPACLRPEMHDAGLGGYVLSAIRCGSSAERME